MKCFPQLALACTALFIGGCAHGNLPTIAASDTVTGPPGAFTSGKEILREAINDWVARKYRTIAEQENIPALSVGIIYDGEEIGYFNYGTRSRDSTVAIDENTLFQIASLSKTLTGIATQSLIAEGRLDIRQPIATYLPDILEPAAQRTLSNPTLGQLLQHSSGIITDDCTLYRDRKEGEPWLGGYSRAQLVADINAITLDGGTESGAEPEFVYSNCGYAIVGLIDEIATGRSYAQLLHDRVTSKFGMPDTVVNLSEAQQHRLALPYRKDDRMIATRASDMGAGTPGSGVYSTVSDLLTLQVHQIHAYREFADNGKKSELLLTENTSPGPRPHMRYGSGMIVFDHPTAKIYLHDGDADGFAGAYGFSPEHNIGVVLQTSSGGPWVPESVVETLIGLIDQAYNE